MMLQYFGPRKALKQSKTFVYLTQINSDSNAELWNQVASWGQGGIISLLCEFLGCGTPRGVTDVTLLLCVLSDVRK